METQGAEGWHAYGSSPASPPSRKPVELNVGSGATHGADGHLTTTLGRPPPKLCSHHDGA
jgi:hypothetical protein